MCRYCGGLYINPTPGGPPVTDVSQAPHFLTKSLYVISLFIYVPLILWDAISRGLFLEKKANTVSLPLLLSMKQDWLFLFSDYYVYIIFYVVMDIKYSVRIDIIIEQGFLFMTSFCGWWVGASFFAIFKYFISKGNIKI